MKYPDECPAFEVVYGRQTIVVEGCGPCDCNAWHCLYLFVRMPDGTEYPALPNELRPLTRAAREQYDR